MTEFAYSGLGINRNFGTPANPWDRATRRIPGGSSSGGAASVADGIVPATLGTDTGGSCRIPAAFSGIVGLKTTTYRVPRASFRFRRRIGPIADPGARPRWPHAGRCTGPRSSAPRDRQGAGRHRSARSALAGEVTTMASSIDFDLTLVQKSGERRERVKITKTVVGGWTARDQHGLRRHIEELAKIGVPRPEKTPLFYRVSASRLTIDDAIEVLGEGSSGEVERGMLKHGSRL